MKERVTGIFSTASLLHDRLSTVPGPRLHRAGKSWVWASGVRAKGCNRGDMQTQCVSFFVLAFLLVLLEDMAEWLENLWKVLPEPPKRLEWSSEPGLPPGRMNF